MCLHLALAAIETGLLDSDDQLGIRLAANHARRTSDDDQIGMRCIDQLALNFALLLITLVALSEPLLAPHQAETTVEIVLTALVDERGPAGETGMISTDRVEQTFKCATTGGRTGRDDA
jgi:hypothetical protein